MSTPTLLVLAAGMGSRYGGLKQVDPVGPDDETIMDYSIFDAHKAGFGRVVFVIRKEIEKLFVQKVGARYEKRIAVDYVFQEIGTLPQGFALPSGRVKPWGTAHAILMAAAAIQEPFAVINADDFYGAEGYRALAHHLQLGTCDYAMVGYTLRETLSDFGAVARAVCQVDDEGSLLDIFELKRIEREDNHTVNRDSDGREMKLTGNEIVSMNMWGFTPRIFDLLRESFQKFLERHGADLNAECYLPSTVNDLIHAGKAHVKVLRSSDSWFGITYREDRGHAVESIRRLIESGAYPKRLWS
jgi:NDP-sugar pyrophosphorylase family protein